MSTTIAAPYHRMEPTAPKVPILISIPHCGTSFPKHLEQMYVPHHVERPDDTDWFLRELYDFASACGITVIAAEYSRYVIDLNRSPENTPLYKDGRTLTGLVSPYTFMEEPLYRAEQPTEDDIAWRKKNIYAVYHTAVRQELQHLRSQFSDVLLWEAHSIRRHVPTIRKEPFPDMIIGDVDRTSADLRLSYAARSSLMRDGRVVQYNDPFKGGYLTRSMAAPQEGIHAIQLEMAKDLYMDEEHTKYLPERAESLSLDLRQTLLNVLKILETM